MNEKETNKTIHFADTDNVSGDSARNCIARTGRQNGENVSWW